MQAARPRRNKPPNRLTGLEVALQKFAARMICGVWDRASLRARFPTSTESRHPPRCRWCCAIPYRLYGAASGPVHQIGALRYFLGDPQTLGRALEAIGMPFGDRKSLTTAFGLRTGTSGCALRLFFRLGHSRDGESCRGQAEKIPSSHE
jgi:hypothetical protein